MSRKRKKNGGSTRLRKSELVRHIINIFRENPETVFNYKQLSKLLTIKSESQKVFINEILYELHEEDYLVEVSKGKFRLNSRGGFITGTITREGVKTYRLIHAGGPFPYEKDGTVFGNRERLLPRKARGYYREYTVRTPGLSHRGARRIVCGGEVPRQPDACYYTADHYASFRMIVGTN